ncbi:MAG: threonine/serine dehydratase [Planctomycetaceae bacterium]|nr:threonine/serine dehydratase [Planctomycetaceae bacterium]
MNPSPINSFCLSIDSIRTAHERIHDCIIRTPTVNSPVIGSDIGCDLWLKCENLQFGGAFKARGACNAVLSLTDEQAAAGVVTHSSGNHAAALARAARIRGITAHIVMPENSSPVKLAAVRAFGIEPILCGPSSAEREQTCERIRRETNATLIHPFDHADVIAGQGTVALEILEQLDAIDTVVVPVGGGGLLAGTLVAVKSLRPSVRVVAAEPSLADDAVRSLQAGVIQAPLRYDTVADGLRTQLGQLTFPIIQQLLDEILTVDEDQILDATTRLMLQGKLLSEPSGAVTTACVLQHGGQFSGQRVVAVISGGNLTRQFISSRLLSDP